MDLSKIKMVVTDMDGTLLNSNNQVSKEFFKLFADLKSHDVHFVAASGRQYYSIIEKLDVIKNDISVIAENGGLINYENQDILTTILPLKKVKKIIPLLRKIDNSFMVLCGKKNAYIETNATKSISILKEYYSKFKIVKDLTEIENDMIFKIAIYHFKSSENYIYPFVKHLENEIEVKISGEHWVDLSHFDANKGYALKILQDKLRVSKEETMVFGDYNNDIEMLECAHYSFAMSNAHKNVKAIANYKTKSNNDGGVEYILEQLIKDKKRNKS